MSKSNCEPALLSSLETLQHNLQDAGMLRMKASLYSEAAVREALGDKACVYVTKIVQCELRDVLRLLEAK